jgi:hypothetical protein
VEREEIGSRAVADPRQIPEPARDDQEHGHARALEQRVRGDRRAASNVGRAGAERRQIDAIGEMLLDLRASRPRRAARRR